MSEIDAAIKYAVQTASPTGRVELTTSLTLAGISAEQVYAKLMQQQPAFHQIHHETRGPHHAQRFVDHHLCLPIYPELSDAEITRIIMSCDPTTRGETDPC
jgi:dTDP-4-amino-4,6-dideoxygalactose transaminase